MIIIKKKLFFLQLTEIWFEYKFRWKDLFLPVAYLDIKKTDQKFYGGTSYEQGTVEVILDAPIDNIFSSFRTTVKTEIRKAEKEGIHCYFTDDVDGFIDFFNDFAVSKKLESTSKRRLEEMGGHLKISYAVLNGVILAAHTYIEDKEVKIARQMHSASKRFDENFNHNQIARANKLLHYKDMIYFKERGIHYYDFGGYHAGKELQGLLDFKLSFGGKKAYSVNYHTYCYDAIKRLQGILKLFKK